MRPILLIIGVVLLIVSLVRYYQVTRLVWNEVLTPARLFNLTWLPTLGVLVAGILIGAWVKKK
jgi:hypothetical protein